MKNMNPNFNNKDAIDYLKTIIAVAKADDDLNENEILFINSQAQLYGLDASTYWNNSSLDLSELHVNKFSHTIKLSIIRDCIVLGHIDRDFNDTERSKVIEIAEKMGLTSSDVDNIEIWLKDYWSVLERGNMLFGEK
jgi:hypothetical protein